MATSVKTVAEKLLVKPGSTVHLPADPDALRRLGPLPEGANAAPGIVGADVVVLLAPDLAALEERLADLPTARSARAVWFLYPKGRASDITRDAIRERVEQPDVGWTTVAIAAVDPAWSALRVKPAGDGGSLEETLDVLDSPEEMAAIKESQQDIAEGRAFTADEVRAEMIAAGRLPRDS